MLDNGEAALFAQGVDVFLLPLQSFITDKAVKWAKAAREALGHVT